MHSLLYRSRSLCPVKDVIIEEKEDESASIDFDHQNNPVPHHRDSKKTLIPVENLHQSWFWGDAKRSETDRALLGLPDGSFNVRFSASKNGDFTITLR